MTNLVQTINGKDRYIIYYDADVFNENVTLSIHLTLPKITNTSGPVEFSQVEAVEWNTIYEEEFGTSGSLDGQKTESFNVSVQSSGSVIKYQDYDFSIVTSSTYSSYGSNGTSGYVTNNINVVNNSIDLQSFYYNSLIVNLGNGNNTIGPYTGVLSVKSIKPGTFIISFGANILTDNGNGVLSGNGSGSINYVTGNYSFTSNAPISTLVNINAAYDHYVEDYGVLTLDGQISNYYQTVNNIPQYIVQQLSEIAVQIWSLPPFVQIIGESDAPSGSTFTYTLPSDYDPGNAYLYQWRLRKIKTGDTDTSNARAEIVGYVSTPSNIRSVVVHFKKNGFVNLEVIVFGPTGCPRIVRKQICVELPLTKMLIIRNRLI